MGKTSAGTSGWGADKALRTARIILPALLPFTLRFREDFSDGTSTSVPDARLRTAVTPP
jgi:hypothetical protein